VLCARKNLTLLEMLELLSLGGEELRRSVLHDFDNRVVRRELEDLQVLADKQPQRFLEYVESTRNRFVRRARRGGSPNHQAPKQCLRACSAPDSEHRPETRN
jgi:hypothetical protein